MTSAHNFAREVHFIDISVTFSVRFVGKTFFESAAIEITREWIDEKIQRKFTKILSAPRGFFVASALLERAP